MGIYERESLKAEMEFVVKGLLEENY